MLSSNLIFLWLVRNINHIFFSSNISTSRYQVWSRVWSIHLSRTKIKWIAYSNVKLATQLLHNFKNLFMEFLSYVNIREWIHYPNKTTIYVYRLQVTAAQMSKHWNFSWILLYTDTHTHTSHTHTAHDIVSMCVSTSKKFS